MFARLLFGLLSLTLLSRANLLGQTGGAWPLGLLVSKDPQTGYVSAFEYSGKSRANQYVTVYTLSGGQTHQIPNSAVVEDVRYPQPATRAVPRTQIDGNLNVLENLSRQYPQYVILFSSVETRLRIVPTFAPPLAQPVTSAPTPGSATSLTLRDGTRYQDVTVLHAEDDRFTIRYQKGVAEVLFRDLPTELKNLPSAIQPLVKAYQERAAAAESIRRQAQATAATSTPIPDVPSILPTSPSQGTPAMTSAPKSNPRGPTIKGICLGMHGAEAAKIVIDQGEGKLEVRPMPAYLKQNGYAIYRKPDSRYNSAMVGRICTDPSDDTVINIIIMPLLSNLLFNTPDQSANEFAQSFIDAYNIPTITPTGVGPTRAWSYNSSEGWNLYIYPDKSVQILLAPSRRFD